MAKIDPVVRKETAHVALWVAVAILPVQIVFALLRQWDYTVPLGSILGSVTAVGNFLLMGLTVQKALEKDKKDAARTVQLSQSGRLMLQGAMLVLAACLPRVFNLWAAMVPLLVPTLTVRLRHLKLAKDNPSPDRPAIGWDDEDEDDEE